MNKKQIEELLKEHCLTNDKDFVKSYKENPPQIIEKLQWFAGEGIVSELSTKDLVQLLSRYLNDNGIYIKNILHFILRIEKLLTFIAEKEGIDVNKAFKEDAKKVAEKMEENLQKSKEAIKKYKE